MTCKANSATAAQQAQGQWPGGVGVKPGRGGLYPVGNEGSLHQHTSTGSQFPSPHPPSCPTPGPREGTHQAPTPPRAAGTRAPVVTITHSIVLSGAPANKAINYGLSLSRRWLERQSMRNPSLPALGERRQMP